MITRENLKDCLTAMGFTQNGSAEYVKTYHNDLTRNIVVDFKQQQIEYPAGLVVNEKQTTNFSHPENFVVLECVDRLLTKGYRPEHIELEKKWRLGHQAKSGRADICVYDEHGSSVFLIIECKTAGQEYKKELKQLHEDGGQLFSYRQQEGGVKWLCLYASDFAEGTITYENEIVSVVDDEQVRQVATADESILLYEEATSMESLFTVWKETYASKTWQELIFGPDTVAYKIGVRPLRKKDLKEFRPDDNIVNRFEEILRHNNVSDKENAFNKLVALFICKLVDELGKSEGDELEFQYRQGSDTYETLQDRLQRLHRDGMEQFMREPVSYIPSSYPEELFATYTGAQRELAIQDLQEKLRILKFYSNNDFAFKDVHNAALFLQNGKVLVEMVQLFERYRIVYPSRHQFLGDLFEQLLNQGFKQNEGQFFTPMPIARFIWDALPVKEYIKTKLNGAAPRVIDYACGAGHFLTESVEAVNDQGNFSNNEWIRDHVVGIEKDYRLARVARISLYMNGAGDGQIVYGDGLENVPEQGVENESFDILVANPPYSVRGFKSHMSLRNNTLQLLDFITNDGNEIEVLFVERTSQLLKSGGLAAIILPVSFLTNGNESYSQARQMLLREFYLKGVVSLGSKTFGATGTNTVILFLEKRKHPPRFADLMQDAVNAIARGEVSADWLDQEILEHYSSRVEVPVETIQLFFAGKLTFDDLQKHPYYVSYLQAFKKGARIDLSKKAFFKKLDPEKRATYELSVFYDHFIKIECEKIFYFALTYRQKTALLFAPEGNKEQEAFLGYKWSNRRGQEGIQIINPGGSLYDAVNRNTPNTSAAFIREQYLQATLADFIPTLGRAQLCTTSDMLNLSESTFTSEMRIHGLSDAVVQFKFPCVPLGDVCDIKIGATPDRKVSSYFTGSIPWLSIAEMNSNTIVSTKEMITQDAVRASSVKLIPAGTTLLSFKLSIGKVARAGVDLYTNEAIAGLIPLDRSVLLDDYLFYLFDSQVIEFSVGSRAFGKSLNSKDLSTRILIPLPPVPIQERIVVQSDSLVSESSKLLTEEESLKAQIRQLFQDLDEAAATAPAAFYRLGDSTAFSTQIGRRVVERQLSTKGIPVYSANVITPMGLIEDDILGDFSKDSVLWGIDGDWQVNVIEAGVEFYPTDHCGVLRINQANVHPQYLAHLLSRYGQEQRFSRSNRASTERIRRFSFPAPSLELQERAIEKISKLRERLKTIRQEHSRLLDERRALVRAELIM